MPRPPIAPGEHGVIGVKSASESSWSAMRPLGEFVAVTRFNDPLEGVQQIRRYGATADEARAAVEAVCAERAKRSAPQPQTFDTFGDAVDWWWTSVRPMLQWSAATERNYVFARQHVDRALSPLRVPLPREDFEAVLDSVVLPPSGRTRSLITNLIELVARPAHLFN